MNPCDYRLPIVKNLSRVRRMMAAAGPQAFAGQLYLIRVERYD